MIKKNINDFNTKIFEEFDKNYAIITAGDKFVGFNGMTISWGGLGTLWNKPVAYIFVRKSRYTHSFMDKSESLTISFLNKKYKSELSYFGSKSGRDVDKFKETGLHASFEPDYNGYFVAEADYVLKCKKLYSTEISLDNLNEDIKNVMYQNGDLHTMYVYEIKHYLVNEE